MIVFFLAWAIAIVQSEVKFACWNKWRFFGYNSKASCDEIRVCFSWCHILLNKSIQYKCPEIPLRYRMEWKVSGGGRQLELLGYSISHCDRVNLELFNRLAVKLKWTADVSLNYYSIIPSFYSDFMFNQRQKKRAVDACLCQWNSRK